MYKQQIEQKLKEMKLQFSVRGNEVQCRCLNPEHKDSNPSFSINTNSGFYNCFSCGFKGHIQNIWDGLEIDEESLRFSQYSELLDSWEVHIDVPKEFSEDFMPPVNHLVDYDVRGVPKELLIKLGVYYCSLGRYKGRLILPIKDVLGKLLGFEARSYQPKGFPTIEPDNPQAKYLRPTSVSTKQLLYPLDYVADNFEQDYVILTEGVFDAISYIVMGYPAVCNFGLGFPDLHKVGRMKSLGITTVINGLDNDVPGIQAWQGVDGRPGLKEQWAKWFTIGQPLDIIKKVQEHGKDANEYLQLYYNPEEVK